MKKKFYNLLNNIDEATTVFTPGGAYPTDGSGVSGDDDLPAGTTVFGDKYEFEMVPNRLTGATKRWTPAKSDDWNYDEFENSMGMGSWESYHSTLSGLDDLLGDRHWKHTDKYDQRLHPDKERLRKANDIDQTAKLSDDEGETADVPVDENDIIFKINDYIKEEDMIEEATISLKDRRALTVLITRKKNFKVHLKDFNSDVELKNQNGIISLTYKHNDDITVSLVDIADALGYDFDVKKQGSFTTFNLREQ